MKKEIVKALKSPVFKIIFIALTALFFLMLCSSDNSDKVNVTAVSTAVNPVIDSIAIVPSQLLVDIKGPKAFENYYFLQRGDTIKLKSSLDNGLIAEIVGCYTGNCPKGESFFISKERFSTASNLYYKTHFRLDKCCLNW